MLDTTSIREPDCRPLLADPDDLTVVFQPIVDLTSATVAGYEAQARFPGTALPDVWFAAAAEAGLAAELQALAIIRTLRAVPDLPLEAFLLLPVDTRLLTCVPVLAALASVPTLRRVVVELTGRGACADLTALRDQAARLRGRGASIAVADAGSGGSGLSGLAELRPQVVRLDHALVAAAGRNPGRRAEAELVGTVARGIDAYLVADGVTTAAELAAVVGLGVPLAQGWLLGAPGPGFAPLTHQVVDLVRGQVARARQAESVAGLLRPVRQHEDGDVVAAPPYVVLDRAGAAVELVLPDPRTGAAYRTPVTLAVPPSAGVPETLQRALARPLPHRFEPVLCTTPHGDVLGLLRVEDLASAAASR